MVNKFTNINKTKKYLSPEHRKDHDIWSWKSRFWLGTGTNVWRGWNRFIGSRLPFL